MENHGQDHDNGQALAPRSNTLARTDFSGTLLSVGNAATEALAAKARADTEARWIMAMRRPRNLDNVRHDILKECRRPGFADVAIYSVPRGDTRIEGLSIRFAEVAVRCMGNVQPEVVTIYDDASTRIVKVTVTDYESNVTWSKDLSIGKTVERKFLKKGQRSHGERMNSYGERVYIVDATDDDVNTKEAAQVSKAIRTLILRIIPGHIQDEAFDVCAQIAADKSAKDPDGARIAMLDSFGGIGVKPSEIEELLGHSTERMAPVEIERLRRLFAGIRDGEVTWVDALAEGVAARAKAPAATTSKGKGTAALKSQISDKPKATGAGAPGEALDKAAELSRERDAARAATPQAEAEAEPGWMSGKAAPAVEVPPGEPPPREGFEDRACAGCGVVIEVETATPAGAQCYVCRQA